VTSPGRWFLEEVKYALRNAPVAVAVTKIVVNLILDFSKPPGLFRVPRVHVDENSILDLSEREVHSL
jgi:hypothetical protein